MEKQVVSTLQKGSIGNFFVYGILVLLIILSIMAVGGLPSRSFPTNGKIVSAISPTPGSNHTTLQLKTFGYVTLTPTPNPRE